MPSSVPPGLYTLSLHDALPILGGIGCESLLLGDVCFEPREHGVECVGELAKLVSAAFQPDPVGQRSGRGQACGVGDAGQRGEHARSEEHTSELQSLTNLVCRLLCPPVSTLFPYTTLFRSWEALAANLCCSATCASSRASMASNASASSQNSSPRPSNRIRWDSDPVAARRVASVMRVSGASMRDRKSTRLNSSH